MAKVVKKAVKKAVKKVVKKDKKAPVTKELKVSKKWEDAPCHVEQDGITYEKVYEHTVNLELDLDESTMKLIRTKFNAGMYVSDGELLRDAIKSMILVEKKNS